VQTVANDAGTLLNSGTIKVMDGATLALSAAAIINSGSVNLQGVSGGGGATLQIDANVTLSGGGKVSLSSNGDNAITDNGSAVSLTNVNNTIVGAGTIGSGDTNLTLINRGTINANSMSALTVNTGSNAVINSGTLEATSTSGLIIDSNVSNAKTSEALGTSATVTIENSTIGNATSGLVLASGSGAQVQLDSATISGGNLQTSSGGQIDIIGSGNVLSGGTITSASLVKINNGGTLTLVGSIANSGTISANGSSNPTELDVSGTVLLSGGGKVSLSPNENNEILAASSGATLTNVNNTIAGAGTVGSGDNSLSLTNKGTINANTMSTLTINTGNNAITNSGTLESTSTGGLVIDSNVSNAKTIEALGTSATVMIENSTISNTASGLVLAAGSSALVELDGAIISGGKLQTSGSKAAIETAGATSNVIVGATIAAGSLVEANNLGTLTLSGSTISGATVSFGETISSGAIVEATSGGTAVVNGGTVGSGAIVETLSGGTAIVSGTIANSGTLYANGFGSLLEIANGAVVSGGVVEVGNGVVDIQGASSKNVTFQAGGSGGLVIADGSGSSTDYAGKVSGFGVSGGASHADHSQYVELTSVTFASGQMGSSYSGTATSGVLTITSGGTVVAAINFVGAYTLSNFLVTSDGSGHVKITDPSMIEQPSDNAPAMIAGGTVLEVNTPDNGKVTFGGSGGTLQLDQPGTFTGTVLGFATPDRIDLPSIGFGTTTTLAFSENDSWTGGTLTVTDGTHTAAIALLGNYMASTLVTAADGHGGTLVTESPLSTQQPQLTQPHHA